MKALLIVVGIVTVAAVVIFLALAKLLSLPGPISSKTIKELNER